MTEIVDFKGRIDVQALGERDRWICGICGRPIDSQLKDRHPLMPSADHIHPIALGGSFLPDNLQIAHLRCNVEKGARFFPGHLPMGNLSKDAKRAAASLPFLGCPYRIDDYLLHEEMGPVVVGQVTPNGDDFSMMLIDMVGATHMVQYPQEQKKLTVISPMKAQPWTARVRR